MPMEQVTKWLLTMGVEETLSYLEAFQAESRHLLFVMMDPSIIVPQ